MEGIPFHHKQRFNTHEEFENKLQLYTETSRYDVTIDDSKKTKDNKAFPYAYRAIRCPKSGIAKSKGTGKRNKKSSKTNCPFLIRVKLSGDNKTYLEISKICLLHNHTPEGDDVDYRDDGESLWTPQMGLTVPKNQEVKLIMDQKEPTSTTKNGSDKMSESLQGDAPSPKKLDSQVNFPATQAVDSGIVQNADAQATSKSKNVPAKESESLQNVSSPKKLDSQLHSPLTPVADNGLVKIVGAKAIKNKNVPEHESETLEPPNKKARGRPKNSKTTTAIGLPIAKRKLLAYVDLPLESKLKKILIWLGCESNIIKLISDGEYIIKHDYLQEYLKNLPGSLLADEIDLDTFKNCFDSKSLRYFKIAIAKQKKKHIFVCGVCGTKADALNRILCSSCLICYHIKCEKTKKLDDNAKYFCKKCVKNNS